ncbi:hypothetical protein IKG02_01180 [Candidatus Saccharibacteria bacterium]|nr:hypothetical protein [Candidatus Saccharibacteria bacterium]
MSSFVSLGIVLLSGLILASLQAPLASFLLLYHSSFGKNIKKKTKSLASSYVSGVAVMVFLLLATSVFLISALSFSGSLSLVSLVVLFGVLLALSLLSLCFYYKFGRSTELWLPRKVSKFISSRARATSDNSEAFALGMFVTFCDLLFSFPLFILSANAILSLSSPYQVLALAGFTILSCLPLVILRLAIRKGKNLADVQRWRLKNKNFFRFFSGLGFLVLAVFLFAFLVIGDKI